MARRKTVEAVDQMVEEAVARIQQLAVNGVAPTQKQYDQQRGSCCNASTLLRRGWTWQMLVKRAGLRLAPSGAAVIQQRANRWTVPQTVEAEIAAAFAAQEETAAWLRAWLLPDGSGVYRVTRAYASLR